MVQCQFSVLLQINFKVENIMRCLGIQPQVNREVIQEPQILAVIISNISTTLDGLLQKDHREELLQEEAGKMYENMERQLQRQENLNRSLIKKQLQSKEYQKSLFDELAEERKTVKQLQNQLNKTNDKILAKDFEILQLNNEKKMMSKDTIKDKKSKELFMFETLINDKKLLDPFKHLVKDNPTATHRRRNSDEVSKRPSTAQVKKKGSVSKK